MPYDARICKTSEFGLQQVESSHYKRAQLRDDQGHRREIILRPPYKFHFIIDESSPCPELHTDLGRALKPFSLIEKRILLRVLVQGQSLDVAVKRSKRGREYWRVWLQRKALPMLKQSLSDYLENGKVVI